MALLAIQQEEALNGASPVFVTADAAGDTWPNLAPEPRVYVLAIGSPVVATVETKNDCQYGGHGDHSETIPPGIQYPLGEFPYERYTDGNGLAKITFDVPANARIAIVQPMGDRLRDA